MICGCHEGECRCVVECGAPGCRGVRHGPDGRPIPESWDDLASDWEWRASRRYAATAQLSDTARGIVAAEAEALLRCAAQLRELMNEEA